MAWKDIAAMAAIAWPVVTGLVNLVLGQKSDEEWVAFAERSPKLAAVSKFLKAAGLNPVGVVKAVRGFFARKELTE